MATVVLQAAGALLGGIFGPVGAAIGSAAGAMAGYALDSALINGTRRYEGPRLTGARPYTAEEGAPLARVYGTARTGGTLIWATRFEESQTTKRQGGKGGGPKVTEYSYYVNAAFALCEGKIAGIRRIWADGRELDRELVEIRVHNGSENQAPDPLIEAKQGAGNAPAYRGTAYVVFERLPIGDYGNRIPQVQFEVLRPVGEVAEGIHAVALIPGSTEFGLSPHLVTREISMGDTEAINRHVLYAATDLEASLDELQALCPNLQHVALVVAWFGDDLRAGQCRIRPAVTDNLVSGFSEVWQVSGLTRSTAPLVSSYQGGAAYGGSPSDRTVIDAIAEIKRRGLKVTLYPFVMMDIAADNTLPDPYGKAVQSPYPWRGRITCHPAPLRPASADGTAAARTQVSAFCGTAEASNFSVQSGSIAFNGTPGDWGYRRFVLHFARLADAAGGVDAFLVGSELRGLTTLRDQNNAFPFVEELCDLAGQASAILGPATKITYGADWTEYFGHHPQDGSGDVFFHLDQLWSHAAVNAVGIDNYMPLSDWQDQDCSGGNPDAFAGPYDPDGLRQGVQRRRGLRLVLSVGNGARQSAARPDHRRRLWQAMGIPLQGYRGLVVEPSLQPNWRAGGRPADRLGTAIQADLVDRDRLPGGGQGTEPAERFSRSEIGGKRLTLFLERRALRSRCFAVSRGPSRLLGPGKQAFRIERKSSVADLRGANGGAFAHLCMGMGCAAISGFSPEHRTLARRRQLETWSLAEWKTKRSHMRRPDQRGPCRSRIAVSRCRECGRYNAWLCHLGSLVGQGCARAGRRSLRAGGF